MNICIIVQAQDANGWKDVDIIEVKLGGNSKALANYGTTLWFHQEIKALGLTAISFAFERIGWNKRQDARHERQCLIVICFRVLPRSYRFHLIGACHLKLVRLTTKEYATHFQSRICVALNLL